MVSDYALKDNVSGAIASVPSPQPVQPTANPNTFYWITGGSKHGYVTANYSGVNGPLVTDIYYSVATPAPDVTASPVSVVALPTNFPAFSNGVTDCTEQVNTAIALGDPCTTPGITWTFKTSNVPAYGAGNIAMLQIANTVSASGAGVPSPGPASYSTSGLDGAFPYSNTTSAAKSGSWTSNDSPAYQLLLPPRCSSLTYSGTFTDYFMYQPAGTSSRNGSRLWASLATMKWNFSGTASNSRGVYKLSNPTNPAPTLTVSAGSLPTWTQIASFQSINC
jgi:hypothetical protein